MISIEKTPFSKRFSLGTHRVSPARAQAALCSFSLTYYFRANFLFKEGRAGEKDMGVV